MVLSILFVVISLVAFCFVVVLLAGAPFLPTLKPQIAATFTLLDLCPGDTILELGCGDGRVLIAAAKLQIQAVGYELNPILAALAWLRTIRYRKYVRVVWSDFWGADWPEAQAIFAFLLDRYMDKLDRTIQRYPHRPLKVASFAFQIPHKQPTRTDKGIFLYEYR